MREQLEPGRERYAAHLISGRARYDVTGRIDLGMTSIPWSGNDDRLRKAFGAEVGLLVMENTWLSLGYNTTASPTGTSTTSSM